MYKLYVDDMREPFSADWVVCKSVNEAMELIKERGLPAEISMDHDLGEGQKTGYDFTKELTDYIIENALYDEFLNIDWNYHTANPVGRDNMKRFINSMTKLFRAPHGEQE